MIELLWSATGFICGVLGLLTAQMVRARQGRHHMMYDMKLLEPEPTKWDEAAQAELFVPTPRANQLPTAPALQECPDCGRAFKRLSQHRRMTPACASTRDVSQ